MPASYIQSSRPTVLSSQSSITTSSFAVQAGDTLVAAGMMMRGDSPTAPMTLSDSQSLTWTKRAEVQQGISTNYVVIWTATAASTGNMSVTFNKGAATNVEWSVVVQTWRGVSGIGSTGTDFITSGGEPPSVTFTTGANSAVAMFVVDTVASDASTTYNTASAGAFTEAGGYPRFSMFSYAFYGGYYADVGAAGSKTFGITQPNNMDHAIAAIELESVSTEILGDGDDFYIMYSSPTYATSREGGGTPTISDTGGLSVGQMFSGGNYYAMQGYLLFNVSGLGSYINPGLKLYSQFDSAVARDYDVELRVHNFGTTSELADFVPGSQLASKTLVATCNTANWPADEGLIPFTVDTDALTGAINAAKAGDGWLRLVANSSYQRTGNSPSGVEYVGILSMETGETDTFPRITYSIPSGPVISAELYENGVLKQFIGSVEVTESSLVSFPWEPSVLDSLTGSNVELRITSTGDVDIGAIQWQAFRSAASLPAATGESWGLVLI